MKKQKHETVVRRSMAPHDRGQRSGPPADDIRDNGRGRDWEDAASHFPGVFFLFYADDVRAPKNWVVRPIFGCDTDCLFFAQEEHIRDCRKSGCSLDTLFRSGVRAVRRALDTALRHGYAITAIPWNRSVGALHLFYSPESILAQGNSPGQVRALAEAHASTAAFADGGSSMTAPLSDAETSFVVDAKATGIKLPGIFFPPGVPPFIAPCQKFLSILDIPLFVHAYGKIVFANDAIVRALGCGGEEEFLGKSPLKLFISENRPLFLRAFLEPGRSFLVRTASSFGAKAFYLRTRPVDEGGAGFFVTSLVPVSKEEQERSEDSFLDIPSRQEFLRMLDRLLRNDVPPFAIVLIDIDRFKVYNDVFGPEICDELLCATRDLFRSFVEGHGFLARMAGDEYGLVYFLPSDDLSVRDEFLAKLTAIARGDYDPFVVEGRTYHLTFSGGVAFFPDDGRSVEDLLRAAEGALVSAKEQGRGKVVRYAAQGKHMLVRQLILEMDLWGALERGELVLYYQPLYDVLQRKLIGMEALLRWHHPEMGLIPPAEFLPQAEDTGLIVPIGEWVLKEALRQLAVWERETGEVLRAYVNVSAVQFEDPEFVRRVSQIVDQSEVEPGRLELELTESVLMRDIDTSIGRLWELKRMGIRIAVDDFGTGYSSLSYLRRLPIDAVKIDRSFVWEVKDERDTGTIATAVIYLAHALGLEVVAEGVETEWQKEFLASNSLQIMQGFYFGKPLPAEDFASTYLKME